METNVYRNQHDYPPIQVAGKNREYATAMLSNVGGSNSEMSAVSLYFYNNLITENEIAQAFHQISIVEMHHLKIFGKLALELGADPRLWERKRNMVWWTPSYNKYPTQLKVLLQNSLQGELAAIEKYERQASVIKDENIVENLHRIILDEQIHVEIFKEMLT